MSNTVGPSYRWVLRSYPAEYREAVGDELVGTANALSGNRWSFRQATGFLIGGLRTRERVANKGDWLLSAARGFGIAMLVAHLAPGLSLALTSTGIISATDWVVEGEMPLGVMAGFALVVVVLLLRGTGKRTLAAIAVLDIGYFVSLWLAGSAIGISWLVISLATLWFIGRYGNGEAVLSKPFVIVLAALLVGLGFTLGEPFAPLILRPALMLAGIALVRIRPSLSFAAALTVASDAFGGDFFNFGNVIVLTVAVAVGAFARRSVERTQTIA